MPAYYYPLRPAKNGATVRDVLTALTVTRSHAEKAQQADSARLARTISQCCNLDEPVALPEKALKLRLCRNA